MYWCSQNIWYRFVSLWHQHFLKSQDLETGKDRIVQSELSIAHYISNGIFLKIKWNFKNSYFIPWQHHINEISWYQLSCSFLCFMCCLNTWMYLKLYPHELTWISIYAFYEALLGSKLDLHSLQMYYKNMASKLILYIYELHYESFSITREDLSYSITNNMLHYSMALK